MKVTELIKQLQTIDGDLEVWQSRDSEGNSFSKLVGYEDQLFVEKTNNYRSDYVHSKDDLLETNDGIIENVKEILVLWPY